MTYTWNKGDIANHNVTPIKFNSPHKGRHISFHVEQSIRKSGKHSMRRLDIAKACGMKLDDQLHRSINYLMQTDRLKSYAHGVYYIDPRS